jgi:N utilization substance protein B
MNRIKQREQAFFLVFQNMFSSIEQDDDMLSVYSENNGEIGKYAELIFNGVCEKLDELDEIIATYLNGWKISRLPKVNLAILRVAVYEMKYVDDVPDSVAINEAVELAKKYSGKEDASFINGVLGAVVRGKK